ncbi:MAG: ABC transporter substrate-binding protein, partial [Thermomicrobiales bacterium]
LWVAGALLLVAIGSFALIWWNDDASTDALVIAVVGPMSGADASIGTEIRNGASIAASDFNSGTSGDPIALVFFDDQNDPDKAVEVAKAIVADGRFIGVIGHGSSSTSIAAAPIYAAAGIPAITAQATDDHLSAYPDYFRTIFSNRSEATILAAYVIDVFKQNTVTIVTGETDYEQSLTADFETAFPAQKGTIAQVLTISSADPETSIADIVSKVKANPDGGMVFLALTEGHGHDFLLASKRAGVTQPMVGSEALGSTRFAQLFADEPEEQATPGFFTDGMYAASPLIYDAVGADAVVFSNNYRAEHGIAPSWRAARVWDAVMAMATASQRANIRDDAADMTVARSAVTAQLHAMNSVDSSFLGLSGPFFFTAAGDSPQGVSIGVFQDARFGSASTQYRLVTNTTQYDMDAEVAAKRAIDLDGYYVRQYRVVYVGVEMIELRDLNLSDQSFHADFFIYFRYNGDDTPLNVVFSNAAGSGLGLGTPLNESVTKDGMNYRLYRVEGTFNEPMSYVDYPWDRHNLTIRFQNPNLTQTDLVYVADPAAIEMSQAERLQSGFDRSRPFNRIPSWQVDSVLYTQASITSSAADYDTEGVVQFSEFQIVMDAGRDVSSFLWKNLLPLVLLTLVTYIAIWFPAEQAGARVGFAITALLSSAVMLNAISGQLPDIGYTVAIEWGYYAYIALSALLVLLTIAVDRSYKAKRMVRVRRLDTFIRVMYPVAILAVAAAYWWRF